MTFKKVVITEFGGPEVLELRDEPTLPEPKGTEVRIRVLAASAVFTDVMIRKGQYPDVKDKPPFSPGYDLVGVVDQLGPGARDVEIGQLVADLTVIGAYTEYICLEQSRLTLVPEGLEPQKAVSLILSYVTAYQMLHRVAKLKKGDSLLIHGAAGAVGTAMLHLGKVLGIKMYGTASKSKHCLVEELGGIPIDYRNEDWLESINQFEPDGVNAVFDAIGGESYTRSFSALKKGGTLVGFGFYNAVMGRGGSIVKDFLKILAWNILPNGKSAKFYSIAALRKKHPDWFKQDLTALFSLVLDGHFEPVIAKTLGLDQAAEAHRLIEEAAVSGKIILKIAER